MTKEKILDKIKKLLELGNTSKNTGEEEAKAAMLKAQELMAKYDISMEEAQGPQQEEYAHEACTHKWDYAYRVSLAQVLAKNFRCMIYMQGKQIVFMGHPLDAKICKETFEFAYTFIMRKGSALYNKRYQMGLHTKGVFNSYAKGFIAGLKESFDIQCKALVIVTPPDVIDEFNEFTKGCKEKTHRMKSDRFDYDAWNNGNIDGKRFMDRDKLPQ